MIMKKLYCIIIRYPLHVNVYNKTSVVKFNLQYNSRIKTLPLTGQNDHLRDTRYNKHLFHKHY